jgi:hypothetical protein
MVKSGTYISLSLNSEDAIYQADIQTYSFAIPPSTISLNDIDISKKMVYGCAVESIIIPNTFYGVRSINNSLTFREYILSTNTLIGTHTIQLSDGNPSLLNVAGELTQKMNAVSSVSNLVAYDKITGKLTFVVLTADRRVELDFSLSNSWSILGFVPQTTPSYSTSNPLEAPRIANVNYDSQIVNIKCNIISSEGNSYSSTSDSSVKQSDILLSLPIAVRPFQFLEYTLRDINLFHIISTKSIDFLSFQLVDSKNRPFSLNGGQFNITMSIRKQSFR